jgi:hypothetical protein
MDIARELQVSKQSISSDMQYLRNQAKASIKEYVTEHLPEQYQVCLTALDETIRRAFDIIQTSDDNREKLQAMELFKDTHLVKLELLSNTTTIDAALHYIRSKQKQEQDKDKDRDEQDEDKPDKDKTDSNINDDNDNDLTNTNTDRSMIF